MSVNDVTTTERRAFIAPYALYGAMVSLALQLWFVASWDSYVRAMPAERLQQRGGVAPPASIASSTRAARDGAVVLLIAGAAVPFLARRSALRAAASFSAAAAAAQIFFGVLRGTVLGNLWPIAVLLIFLLCFIPPMCGALASVAVRRLGGIA
jgi:hypothetical protein